MRITFHAFIVKHAFERHNYDVINYLKESIIFIVISKDLVLFVTFFTCKNFVLLNNS